MDINAAFPSTYLKAADLQNRQVPVTIERIDFEQMDGKTKPILFFRNAQKGMVLNKTNAMTISSYLGPETDGWVGKTIVLYPAMVPFQGQNVPAIRVLPAQSAPQVSTPPDSTGVPGAPPEPPVPAAAPASPHSVAASGAPIDAGPSNVGGATLPPKDGLDDEIPF